MAKILVVVDMQKNFIKQIGAEDVVPRVAQKITKRTRENFEILLTLDKSGGELDERISVECRGAKIFEKRSYGCEELICYLKEKNPSFVEFAGVCTDICVITNALATITVLPYSQIVVDSNCCASQTPEGHRCALTVFKSCNIKVI